MSDSESAPTSHRHHSHLAPPEANSDHEHHHEHHHPHSEHHRHRHRSTSQVPPPNRARAPSPSPSSEYSRDALTVPHRRRAVSLQQFDAPQPHPYAYQTPSVAGIGPVEMYDDGASVAASHMTFMDGSVAGRVSQYGLPKYAHHPKADYRRWVVAHFPDEYGR
jgi:hypothetical protein